jgi:tetratricopeptide (TPR) repeat protein
MAVERNPKYVEALCNIGVIYKNSGQLDSAIQYYEKALGMLFHFKLASSSVLIFALALRSDLLRFAAVNANFVIANNNLAIAFTDMGTKVKNEGDIDTGLKYYKQALVHNAKYPAAWYNLGVAYAELGRLDEAIVAYELAVNFNPKCAKAFNNLGVIYKDKYVLPLLLLRLSIVTVRFFFFFLSFFLSFSGVTLISLCTITRKPSRPTLVSHKPSTIWV